MNALLNITFKEDIKTKNNYIKILFEDAKRKTDNYLKDYTTESYYNNLTEEIKNYFLDSIFEYDYKDDLRGSIKKCYSDLIRLEDGSIWVASCDIEKTFKKYSETIEGLLIFKYGEEYLKEILKTKVYNWSVDNFRQLYAKSLFDATSIILSVLKDNLLNILDLNIYYQLED